jgi:hypothetical protein
MIEELIRKLDHLQDYAEYKKVNSTYKLYIESLLEKSTTHKLDDKSEFPILLKVNTQKDADSIVFNFINEYKESFTFISLDDKDAIKRLEGIDRDELVYLINFQNLKKSEKSKILPLIQTRRAILSTTDVDESLEGLESLQIKNDRDLFEQGDILSIENYVKYIILKYQSQFPDTELSKKLGISRKSLWEKRKKYGISKKR